MEEILKYLQGCMFLSCPIRLFFDVNAQQKSIGQKIRDSHFIWTDVFIDKSSGAQALRLSERFIGVCWGLISP